MVVIFYQYEKNTIPGFNANVYGGVFGRTFSYPMIGYFGGAFAVGGDHMKGKSVLNTQSINSTTYIKAFYMVVRYFRIKLFCSAGFSWYGI